MYTASKERYTTMEYNRCGNSGLLLPKVSLGWLPQHKEVTSVLIGASRPQQILDNIKAISCAPFMEEERRCIAAISQA